MSALDRFWKELGKRDFLWVHFVICSLGFLSVLKVISSTIFVALLRTPPLLTFNDWAQPYHFPFKPRELLLYCFAVPCMTLYLLIASMIIRKSDRISSRFIKALAPKRYWIAYFVVLAFLNCEIYLFNNESFWDVNFIILKIALWTIVVFIPFYSYLGRAGSWFSKIQSLPGLGMTLLTAITLYMLITFVPFLRGSLLIPNEYMDIPEYTRINDHYVNNAKYINEHQILGSSRYDPYTDRGQTPAPAAWRSLPLSALGKKLPSSFIPYIQHGSPDLAYDSMRNTLVYADSTSNEKLKTQHDAQSDNAPLDEKSLSEQMSSTKDWDLLMQLAGTREQVADIERFRHSCDQLQTSLRKKIFTPAERAFYKANLYEMAVQMGGWIIHHHNFILTPILEYKFDKPTSQIRPQYGWVNVLLMKWILEHAGGITFQNYFHKSYLFYPLYYLLFMLLLWLLFRRLDYVLLSTIWVNGSLLLLGFLSILLAPGFNPIRHFFDIFVVASLYLFLKNRSNVAFAGTLLFGLVSRLFNPEFGLFILLAIFATLIVLRFIDKSRMSWMHLAILILATGLALYLPHWFPTGSNSAIRYYLNGIGTIPVHVFVLSSIFVCICIVYTLLIKFMRQDIPLAFTGLFVFFYCQASLIYYVWNPAPDHFLSFAPPVFLLIAILMKLIFNSDSVKAYERPWLQWMILGSLILFYIPMAFANHAEELRHRRIFQTHKVFQWNLKMAQFQSTMDPEPFVDSIRLIEKYSPNRHGIYILSKYDNFLPFLSEKYSLMPSIDLSWYLLTSREVDQTVATIQKAKPDVLFVDTDINRSLDGEILADDYPMSFDKHRESVSRVQRLGELQIVFNAVKQDYRPVESGLLITVYKRVT